MTEFRKGDLLQVNSVGASTPNGGLTLPEGLTVRVVDVSYRGTLVRVFSSVLDASQLEAFWKAERFDLVEEANPATRRDKAMEYLARAEERASDPVFRVGADSLALVGILHLLLDEPVEPATGAAGSRALADRVDELVSEKRDLQEKLDHSWSERSALHHRVDELTTENEQLKEKAEILEAELLVAKNNERAAVADRSSAIEEVARLNREQGVVPTRAEAVAEETAMPAGYRLHGNDIVISDSDGDSIVFELSVAGDPALPTLFVDSVSRSGAYIDPEQFRTLSRHYDRWVNQKGE